MAAEIIDGYRIGEDLKQEVALAARRLTADGIDCGLATVLVGDDHASAAYARRLRRIAADLRIPCQSVALPALSSEQEVLATIGRLNADPAISGILVMRPLPVHVSEARVFQAISPLKDVEALHPENAGLLALGMPRYVPSTAAAAFYLLDRWLDEAGEDRTAFYHRSLIVVVGRSNNVGKPALLLAYDRQAAAESVDEWASASGQLGWHTRRADVLIVAAGVRGLIRSEHVREGAIVIDVGIHAVDDAAATGGVRIVGDVAFEEVADRARAITPVPGGVGPVTDVCLLRNTVAAARNAAAGGDRPLSYASSE
jgi:methylenetetrahydrofolate dehydrogenase (NADP+)/methenyltetrahydrofolate cyclohydrolase